MIYLDSAATTKPKKEVIDVMMPYLTDMWYNPSSLYSPAAKVNEEIKKARQIIGDFINADGNEIFFTSCGSESDNWAVKGIAKAMAKKGKKHLITTTIEHHAILNSMKSLEEEGFEVTYLQVDKNGLINPKQVEDAIKQNTALVSIMYANNEIGTIQPILEIGQICREKGVYFHTDAVQAVGNIKIDVEKQNIDLLSMSGHKINAPKGIAILYIKNGVEIDNLIDGGHQMDGRRAGTENVPYIIAMAKAIEIYDLNRHREISKIRDYFILQLKENFNCIINGSLNNRLCNNISVCFDGHNITAESLLYMLDLSNIYISTKSACNSNEIEISHTLKSIGLTYEQSLKTIRISLSESISVKDVDFVINEIKNAIKILES